MPKRSGINRGRHLAIRRLLYVSEFLRQLRFGEGVKGICREMKERMGVEWCSRTIERDVQLLGELGFVRRVCTASGVRWVWVDRSKSVAECRPEAVCKVG